MKNLFYFLLGIITIFLTSATTVSIMTVKPAKPVSTLVTYGTPYELKLICQKYIKLGYQIKLIESTDYQPGTMLVMEKY